MALIFLFLTFIILLNTIIYNDFCYLIVSFMSLIVSVIVIRILCVNTRLYVKSFLNFFMICNIGIFITAFYSEFFDSLEYLKKDSYNFYEYSLNINNYSLYELREITEGSLAIYIWGFIYSITNIFNINSHYIGLIFNSICLCFTLLLAIRTCEIIYPHDLLRIKIIKAMFYSSGLFILFASFHFRDAFIVLVYAFQIFIFAFLIKKRFSNYIFFLTCILNVIISFIYYFLRLEFFIIPSVLYLVYSFTFLISKNRLKLGFTFIVSISTVFFCTAFILINIKQIVYEFNRNAFSYLEHSGGVNAGDNFAWKLLHDSHIIIQVFIKPIVFSLFPIPFWSKIDSYNSYDLYKMLFTLNCYLYIPLFWLSINLFLKYRKLRNHFNYFNILLLFIFLYGICFTSLEQRHFGPFLINLFFIIIISDFKVQRLKFRGIFNVYLFISFIFSLNILKFFNGI
jgi:hypothetical protein